MQGSFFKQNQRQQQQQQRQRRQQQQQQQQRQQQQQQQQRGSVIYLQGFLFQNVKKCDKQKIFIFEGIFCLLGSGCGKKNCFRNHFLKIFLPVDDFAKADSG